MIERFFTGLPRERDGDHRVTMIEIFFDLVFVFAVTQLSHLLLANLNWHGALQTTLLLLAIWHAWIFTAWVTNWLDPDRRPVRIMLLVLMLGFLVVSATLPDAFGRRGLTFAIFFVAAQIGRTLFFVLAVRDDPRQRRNFQRILVWLSVSGLFWLAGGIAHGTTRELLWVTGLVIDYLGPASGFFVPVLGRSTTRDWESISGAHMAERCQAFLLIALGESIVMTGAAFAGMAIGFWVVTSFVIAFAGSVALWWIYFDRSAEDAAAEIAESTDPGRLARSAYTYLHLPMVAGIIIAAVGDELSIDHPTRPGAFATSLVICGGPALFLAGHALFKLAVWKSLSPTRFVAVAALVVLVPIGAIVPLLVTAFLSTMIVLVVIVQDAGIIPPGWAGVGRWRAGVTTSRSLKRG